jgi:RNA polymerase sigma-70 factor (ECF subfamily)
MMVLRERAVIGMIFSGRGWVGEDFSSHWRRFYDFALSKVRDPHLSEDIAQETMSRLAAVAREKPIENSGALGFSIARNLLRDHFRARRPLEELDDSLACPQPLADDVVQQRQRLAAVARVIQAMPPLRREIFTRRRIQGESPGEIAASLGLSPAAVEKHLVRGLADLHQATSAAEKRGRR